MSDVASRMRGRVQLPTDGHKLECPIISGPLMKSLASWRESHGFGILNIIGPQGENFLVETGPATDASDLKAWKAMSEKNLRAYLSGRGLSDSDIEDAIQLSREWATTITGTTVFPPAKSN